MVLGEKILFSLDPVIWVVTQLILICSVEDHATLMSVTALLKHLLYCSSE